MSWNFDINEAPKGHYENVPYEHNGKQLSRSTFIPAYIMAASIDGKTVTRSAWMPDQQRWNMFTKEHPPIAWQLWPAHPTPSDE